MEAFPAGGLVNGEVYTAVDVCKASAVCQQSLVEWVENAGKGSRAGPCGLPSAFWSC